jgi:hypothetical protein
MKVTLLFPPDWLPSEPYLSLPALTSVLRPAGHDVTQMDINVEMYDMMFGEVFLRHVQTRIAFELRHLQRLEEVQTLDQEESELKAQLSACTDEFFQELIQKAYKAKAILRSQEFYEIDKLEWANNSLHEIMAVVSLGYYPAQICFPPIETDIVYKPFMSSEIIEALDDEQINVYRDVYRFLIEPELKANTPGVVGISIVQ